MEKVSRTVRYTRSKSLRKALDAIKDQGGFSTSVSLEEYLLYGIVPGMQKFSTYCFAPKEQDHSELESGNARIELPVELTNAIDSLADLYSLTPASFVRRALWLAVEFYHELNPKDPRLAKEEFRKQLLVALETRIPTRVN